MNSKLLKTLEKLRKNRLIKSYSLEFSENKLNNSRSEVKMLVIVDDKTICDRALSYNPEIQKMTKVQDILLDEFEIQLTTLGILSFLPSSVYENTL